MMPHEAWAAGVDKEILKGMDKKEIGRQEVLNETMYSEEKYLSDLRILHEVNYSKGFMVKTMGY